MPNHYIELLKDHLEILSKLINKTESPRPKGRPKKVPQEVEILHRKVKEETKFYNYDLIDPKLITEINRTNIDIVRFGGKEFRNKFKYIEEVDDSKYKGSLDFLSDFKNLKRIGLDKFNGNLSPLKGMKIEVISMNSFNGDLTPLKDSPISFILMPSFTGNLDPIKDKKFSGRLGDKFYGDYKEGKMEILKAAKDSDSEDKGNEESEESEEEDEEDIDPEISNLLDEAQELINRNR